MAEEFEKSRELAGKLHFRILFFSSSLWLNNDVKVLKQAEPSLLPSFLAQVSVIVLQPQEPLRWQWNTLLKRLNTTQRNISKNMDVRGLDHSWKHPESVTINDIGLCVCCFSGCLEIAPCVMKDCSSMKTHAGMLMWLSPWSQNGLKVYSGRGKLSVGSRWITASGCALHFFGVYVSRIVSPHGGTGLTFTELKPSNLVQPDCKSRICQLCFWLFKESLGIALYPSLPFFCRNITRPRWSIRTCWSWTVRVWKLQRNWNGHRCCTSR